MTIHYPPFLNPLYQNLKMMINNNPNYIPNFLICTARGTGKTTSTIKIIEGLLYNQKWLINIIKKTESKLIAFIQQFIQTVKKDLNIDLKYNSSKNEMIFGNCLIRGYTLNGEKLSVEKNPPTGLIIDQWAEGVLNIFDECAPDLKPELVNVLIQSIKTDFFKPVPKMNLFMCNPWVSSNYYINKWNINLNYNKTIAKNPPYFSTKTIDGWCYIGASIFANPMCPESDLMTYWETTKTDKGARDIVLLGLPGALNGQVFDNFRFMRYQPFTTFERYFGGIDIGWTQQSGNGGATVLELFKYNKDLGIQGCLEYYHHNKTSFITSAAQQTAMLTKLFNYLNSHPNESMNKLVYISVDIGGDGNVHRMFQDEWNKTFANQCYARVNFFPVSTGLKKQWKLYDRYRWINKCLYFSYIQVSKEIQPRLYMDLESAVYKDSSLTIEKDPVMEHEYSDTIIGGLSYSVIGRAKLWLNFWNEKRKQREKMNINSTSDMTKEPKQAFNKLSLPQ